MCMQAASAAALSADMRAEKLCGAGHVVVADHPTVSRYRADSSTSVLLSVVS